MPKQPKNPKARLFCALGDDNRLRIIKYLSSGEKCVCQIFNHLEIPQNLASHHLGKLKQCNCVCCQRKGKWAHYSLNKKTLKEINLFLKKLSQ